MKVSRNNIPICTTADELKNHDGRTATVEGVLRPPVSKRFPPIIYLSDGAKVAFILSAKLETELKNIREYYHKQIRMTGIIYTRNLPEDFESHLDLPYVVDVETIKVIH